jgi:hypothetical protein
MCCSKKKLGSEQDPGGPSLKEITGYCEHLKQGEGSRSIRNFLSVYWCDISKDRKFRHILGFEIRGT